MQKTIAIMGAGIMATGMGKTLLKNGYSVSCFNRTKKNSEALIDAGAVFYDTPAKAAHEADFVISMVWDKDAFDSIMTGPAGLFENASKDQIFIDMSTQLPETAVAAAEAFGRRDAWFLDAPVHGTKGEANSGGLWIMAGGDKAAYDRAVEVLSVVGETYHYMGCLLYTSPSPRDVEESRMPSSA